MLLFINVSLFVITRIIIILLVHVDIAGDGTFAVSMLAEFDNTLTTHGASYYPRLYWEAGMVGHMLYLTSEAEGYRGTGIGCYFDNPTHKLLGIKGMSLQSLYHFTVGYPIEDNRIMSLPPYSDSRRINSNNNNNNNINSSSSTSDCIFQRITKSLHE